MLTNKVQTVAACRISTIADKHIINDRFLLEDLIMYHTLFILNAAIPGTVPNIHRSLRLHLLYRVTAQPCCRLQLLYCYAFCFQLVSDIFPLSIVRTVPSIAYSLAGGYRLLRDPCPITIVIINHAAIC